MFEDIRPNIDNADSLARATTAELREMQRQFPGIPEDYTTFLRELGSGNLGEIQVYSGPIGPRDVYPLASGELEKVVLIGDDMQGYCFGFDVGNRFQLVEVDPKGQVDRSIERTFGELVRRFFG
jgi:hypothetical protein